MVIVPNKSTIYSEYMPDTIRKFRDTTRLDQFMEHMRRHSRVSVLDLREALFKAKSNHPLYWKTDSHWNSYGAYIGYTEIMRRLCAQLPGLKPVSIRGDEVRIEPSPTGGDLAQMLFLQDSLPEENETRLNLETSSTQPALDTLVLRHDSFGDALYPYFHRHFKNLVNIAPFAPYRFQSHLRKAPPGGGPRFCRTLHHPGHSRRFLLRGRKAISGSGISKNLFSRQSFALPKGEMPTRCSAPLPEP